MTAAVAMDVASRSGFAPDFAAARVFTTNGATVVSVPLRGQNISEASHLTFVEGGGRTTVTEMAAQSIDSDTVHFASWTDGAPVANTVLTKSDSGADSRATTMGFSMDKLKKCLNNAGINWALIAIVGVACSVACAAAVLSAPCIALNAGLTGGTVARCINLAFA